VQVLHVVKMLCWLILMTCKRSLMAKHQIDFSYGVGNISTLINELKLT